MNNVVSLEYVTEIDIDKTLGFYEKAIDVIKRIFNREVIVVNGCLMCPYEPKHIKDNTKLNHNYQVRTDETEWKRAY